jgi:hypothetical protein
MVQNCAILRMPFFVLVTRDEWIGQNSAGFARASLVTKDASPTLVMRDAFLMQKRRATQRPSAAAAPTNRGAMNQRG